MKQRLKKLAVAFMGLCMLLTAAPVTAFAAVGDLYHDSGGIRTGKTTYSYKGQKYETLVLENKYIRAEAYITGNFAAYYVRPETSKDSNPFESNSPNLNMPKVVYYSNGAPADYDYLIAKSVGFSDKNDAIVYQLQTSDSMVSATLTLTLVELNSGYTGEPREGWDSVAGSGDIIELPINNRDESAKCYGVKSTLNVTEFGGVKSGYSSARLEWQDYQSNFSRMGHPTSKDKGRVYSSNLTYVDAFTDKGSSQSLKAVDITNGLSNAAAYSQRTTLTSVSVSGLMKWMSGKGGSLFETRRVTEYVTEIYSDSYAYGNPFILAGDYFYCENRGRIEGHTGRLPMNVSYQRSNDAALTYSYIDLSVSGELREELVNVVGYRDLIECGSAPVVTPGDDARVSSTADKLYVFREGSGYAASINRNYSSNAPLLTIRGMLETGTENGREYYEYTSGKAALSSTVTATWGSGGYLRIYSDGSIVQRGVSLNCPKFKFYSPADADSLKLSFTDSGIAAGIDPGQNKAVISVDIPNVIVKVNSVDMPADGNIVMSGEIAFRMLFGDDNMLSIEKIGYGLKNGEFRCNGIAASGSISTASLVGLELAGIQGEINTFKGEERYAFSLELNAFDMFEAEAELELKRFNKTGDLMPNKIWFYVNAEPGIPLVPPVVVGALTGGGGGVDGLADSFNGNFTAIPPIRFKLKGTGDYLKIISGSATATVGPLYAQWGVEDIKLAGIAGLLTEYETHIGLTGEQRTVNGRKYTGLNANGGMSMRLEVPEGWNIIEAGGSFDANIFGGFDNWSRPRYVYLSADANGKIYGRVKFPKNWKIIGGKTIAKSDLEFALGGNTDFRVRDTSFKGAASEALKNMKFYFGAVKTGKLLGIKYRVYYIAPKKVGVQTAGWFKKLSNWNLRDEIKKSPYTLSLIDSDGMEVGFVTADVPFDELRAVRSEEMALYADASAASDSAHIGMEPNDPLDTEMMLLITPEGGVTGEFKDSLTITGGSGAFDIVYAELAEDTDGNQVITNEDSANTMEVTDDDGNAALLVNLGVQNALNSWDISASGNFTAALNYSGGLAGFEAALSGDTLGASVRNPADGAKYAVRVYYGSRPLEDASENDQTGINDYFAGEYEVSDPDSFSQVLETAGTLAPTGDYVVNAYLMEKFEEDFDADGEIDTAYVTIGSKSLGNIRYTNSFQPEAPADVVIKAAGNEVLHAEWDESADADGYKITVYEVAENGELIETDRGYKYDNEEFSRKSGLGYDGAARKFSMDMALTASGEGDTLSADKTYRIGVQALRYMTDEANERISSAAVPSAETLSNPEFLPEYVPLDIKAEVSLDYGSTFIEADCDSETGMLSFPFNGENPPVIKLSAAGADSADTEYRLFRTDDGSELVYEASCNGFVLRNDAFEGALMLRAQAVNKNTGDVTARYITAYFDDCAPVLTFDGSGSFTADPETGAYTITGQSEPGALVVLSDENGTVISTDDDGSFSYQGTLGRVTDGDGNVTALISLVTTAVAVDAAGNVSDMAALMVSGGRVSAPAEFEDILDIVTVTFDSNGGSDVTAQNIYKYMSASEPGAPAKTGFTFVRWELDGAAYDFSSEVRENITLTARWKQCDHTGNTNPVSCTRETLCSVCAGIIPPAGHKDADGDKRCDVCGADMRNSGGITGGHIRPSVPDTASEPLPMMNGSAMSWDDLAKQLEKLPVNSSAVIDMAGLNEVPQAVVKVIADRKLSAEFRLDGSKSRTMSGADITAPVSAYLGVMPGRSSGGELRGTNGAKFITEKTGVPAGMKLYFRGEFAGQFANLYRVENGRNVFAGTAKISGDGSAEFGALSENAEYIVMVGLSDLPGDANNDGVFNALDAAAILKDIVGAEKLPNPGVGDLNGDGSVNALDAAAVLKKVTG